ncbi:MAG: hypothetical protein AAGH40_07000 [Verrucomicrobiota bacterium]
MKIRDRETFSQLLIWGFLIVCSGCANQSRDKQLERVAKDWSMTIRASQVIPVYPLTEDLVPGDVFLVRHTANDQDKAYRKSEGFLPFDQHITRLGEFDYKDVYNDSFGTGNNNFKAPYSWIFPPNGNEALAAEAPQPEKGKQPDPTAWHQAPQASFPSYNVRVKSGGSAQLALPLQSVAVAFALTQSKELAVSVKLKDAKVYGIPLDMIIPSIRKWASLPSNKYYLNGIASKENEEDSAQDLYLRVVSRVYMIGGVDVSANNTSGFGAGLDASVAEVMGNSLAQLKQGILPTVEGEGQDDTALPEIPAADEVENNSPQTEPVSTDSAPNQNGIATPTADSTYQRTLEELNAQLESASGAVTPGGGVKIAMVTQGSVLLNETFRRPLVIGYLGFDFKILPSGELSVPVSTFNVIYDPSAIETTEQAITTFTNEELALQDIMFNVRSVSTEKQDKIYNEVTALIDEEGLHQRYLKERKSSSPKNAYIDALNNSPLYSSDALTKAFVKSYEKHK